MINASQPTASRQTTQTPPAAPQGSGASAPHTPTGLPTAGHTRPNADAYDTLRNVAKPAAGFLVGGAIGAAAWPMAGLALCTAGMALPAWSLIAFTSVVARGEENRVPRIVSVPVACLTAASMVPIGAMLATDGLVMAAASIPLAPLTAASCAILGAYGAMKNDAQAPVDPPSAN